MTVLVQPSPTIRYQFFDANGDPLAFGLVYTYAAGTNTPLASYTDHTGGVANANPIVLDAGGYADIWLSAASYKISVHDATDVPLYTIDGIPGIGSLISVGSLHPLFSTSFAAGALNFSFDSVAAGQLFGRFAGTSGSPSYGAVGSDTQVTFNKAGQMAGSQDLTWDDTGKVLSVNTGGGVQIRLVATGSGGKIQFGSGTDPSIEFATDWYFTRANGEQMNLGSRSEQKSFNIGPNDGDVHVGIASHFANVGLNDGSSSAGIFAGLHIIAGSVADPNNVVTGETGSLFLTTNGGANTTLWIKESSPTTTTGWVAK